MKLRIAKRSFVLGIVLFNTLALLHPQEANAQDSGCKFQVAKAGQSISSLGAVVSEVVISTNESPHNPFPGKESITFRLGSLSATKEAAKKSADLMNSPGIQTRIAEHLIAACPDVVEVRFNMTATDWDSSFFRGKDGSVIKGTCIDPGRGNAWPLWGFYVCL